MSLFFEAYQKALAEGLAKWTLRGIGILLLAALGFLYRSMPTVAAALSSIAGILLILLVGYVLGWGTSYRKTRQKVSDLERRFDLAEAEKLAERTRMARDMYEIELMNKTTPNTY